MFQTIIILSDTIEIDKITQNLAEFSFDKKETIEQPKQDYLRGRCIEYFTKNEEILNELNLTSELSGIIEQFEKDKETKELIENNDTPNKNDNFS